MISAHHEQPAWVGGNEAMRAVDFRPPFGYLVPTGQLVHDAALDEDVEVLTKAFLNLAAERRMLQPCQYVLVRQVGPRRWFDIVDWFGDLDEALDHADLRGQPTVFDCEEGAEVPSAWSRVAG